MARILVQTDDGVTVESISEGPDESFSLMLGKRDADLLQQMEEAVQRAHDREKAPKRGIVDLLGLGKGGGS